VSRTLPHCGQPGLISACEAAASCGMTGLFVVSVTTTPGAAVIIVSTGSTVDLSKPHSRQKRAIGSNAVPHCGQNFIAISFNLMNNEKPFCWLPCISGN
jgi:hypothetical protein